MRNTYRVSTIGSALLLLGLLATSAHAGPISAVFVHATETGQVGDVLTFSGTITNTGTLTEWVNGDDITIGGFDANTVDDSPYWPDVVFSPSQPLEPGNSIGPVDWFTVTMPVGTPAGLYSGTLTVTGGDTMASDDNLGSFAFNVQVENEASTVPEPATFGLLSAGTLAVLLRRLSVSR